MRPPELPDRLQSAFLGTPCYVQLQRGERLYKFVSMPIVRERVLDSPWWIRQHAFDAMRLRAQRLDRPLAEVVRSHLAIAAEWNPGMDTIWVVVLAAPVDAWEGRARSQRATTARSDVSFLGGGNQACVPVLDRAQIAQEYAGYMTM